jgi:hypothetical protein
MAERARKREKKGEAGLLGGKRKMVSAGKLHLARGRLEYFKSFSFSSFDPNSNSKSISTEFYLSAGSMSATIKMKWR